MELTRHAHATVVIEQDETVVLVDPGVFTPNARELLAGATAVLVTHDHFDHFDLDAVRDALAAVPGLVLYGPGSVVDALVTAGLGKAQLVRVEDGDAWAVGDISVRAFGGDHALINPRIPVPHNVGYLIGDVVFHPGDSYAVPPFAVHTLLVPVSGPWVKIGEAIDFIAAVSPTQTVLVHDIMLSEIGRGSASTFLGADGVTGVSLVALRPGESAAL
ncbi:MBL fold metallo-hydrolase [Leifsonia sp. PS1209]|uniref:MBL fold metallo-hydrolase n=1 Tax=Leifsonia sp. PS1209 TaxID=2724914 RepID=UPI001442C903|nr:MBL fold metallo-hydrolase [Leifsonia sp. PS1209]QIZ98981.1 MBL fold metallo-hydrolase [Leifsonia sp. PS1209]